MSRIRCAAGLAAICLFLPSCSESVAAVSGEPIATFPVTTPERGAVVERSYVAKVRAHRHVEIRARLSGVLEAVEVDEGAKVEANQVLFRLRSRAAELERERAAAERASAAAELDAARIELANLEMLEERGVGSPAELALARSRVAVAEASLAAASAAEQQAAANLAFSVVRAPFAGVIGRLPLHVGSVIDDEQLLTTLTDDGEALAYFKVPEREYLELSASGALKQGHPVRFALATGAELSTEGVIDAVDSVIDSESGSVTFRARFSNDDGRLKHGATGRVILAEAVEDALVIPQRATFEQQHLVYVYTVDNEGVVRARRVVPRARVGDRFVLESGLGPGERIVLEGVQHLRDGARIHVKQES